MANSEEVFPWLKSLPVAPEYRPSLAEFQDPIAYIFKIEKEASKYGICKIIPPVSPSSKKTVTAYMNRSQPRFTTRQQQIGFCPRRPQPVRRPVWHSGHHYSFREFEAKAKSFEKSYFGKGKKLAQFSALEVEAMYWKATADKPFSVEYANDMPGSAFGEVNEGGFGGDGFLTVGETAWNMRGVSRANGSLLKFMKEEIPGVTSPMVYVAMMFSWFAWHVEDHDLHSLNYLHMGASKTWYGVPREAAVAFEDVVRVHGYGGEINPLVTFAILGEKTTVMSPEVFVQAGVPCCRLVQNAGEFVVTFPRAYHTGFNHGFNCGEAANIATPEWLTVAKDAAIRRASINYPPMVSHFQLLYDLGLAMCSRIPADISVGPRSSRLKDKKKGVGQTVIKELFAEDVLQNNDLLHALGKGSSVVLLPRSSSDFSVYSKLRVGSQQLKVNTEFSLDVCNSEGTNSSKKFISDDLVFNRNHGIKKVKGFSSVKEKFATLCERNRVCSFSTNGDTCTSSSKTLQRDTEKDTSQGDGLSDQRLFSCVTCGILSFSCVAIVQPKEPAARYLMSADCSFFNDRIVGSGVTRNKFTATHEDANIPKQSTYTGWSKQNAGNDLYDVPVESVEQQTQIADQSCMEASNAEKGNTALALLAMAYGSSSDSEKDDPGDSDIAVDGDDLNTMKHPLESKSQERPCLPSQFQDCHVSPVNSINNYESYMHKKIERIMSPFDCSINSEDNDITSGVSFKNTREGLHSTLNCSEDTHTKMPLLGKTVIPIDNKNVSSMPPSDEDASRMHVFCLEHAAEAEQQLRPFGGADILLLCHPDYPKIEAEAKLVAEETEIDYKWKNTVYRHANREDEERIQSALDSEEAISGNSDWAVKLGINLFYSANLSRSPLYSKQMPYNSVLYYAFGCSSPVSSPVEPSVCQRRTNRQKKVVAGKWCGKVWMSNQVHPLLAKRELEDVENEKSISMWPLLDEKSERSERTRKSNTTNRKSGWKRKVAVESEGDWEGSFSEGGWLSDNSIEGKCNQSQMSILASKRTRHIEGHGTASEGDYSPLQHHSMLKSKHTKCIGSDAVSDDSLDGNTRRQPWRNAISKEAKSIDSDMVSDDTMDYDSDWPQKEELSDTQYAISEDSFGVGSLQRHRKTPKSKYDQYTVEDVISDDQTEVYIQKQKRWISKSKQPKYLSEEDAVISDDQLEHCMLKQQKRSPKSWQDSYPVEEDTISDDEPECHSRNYQRRIPKGKQAKPIVGEDVTCDDQLECHFQKPRRSMRRSKKNKYSDEENMDNYSAESDSRVLHKTSKRKQAEFTNENDINSDDQMEDDCNQQHMRLLRRKQTKSQTLQQMKQANSPCVRSKPSRPVKRGAQLLIKSKAPRKMKQQPIAWNDQSVNSKDETSQIEDNEARRPPSTRIRKRVQKIQNETEGKTKEKETNKKKLKNAITAKVSAGRGKVKDEEGEYQCDIEGCTMSFYSKQDLIHHKKNICPVKGCGKKFFSHKYLVHHRRVHEDDRPLKCPWKGCKMSFKWAWARTEHIRVHTGARPYVCAEPGCEQTFRFVSDFSRHKRKTGHSVKKTRK